MQAESSTGGAVGGHGGGRHARGKEELRRKRLMPGCVEGRIGEEERKREREGGGAGGSRRLGRLSTAAGGKMKEEGKRVVSVVLRDREDICVKQSMAALPEFVSRYTILTLAFFGILYLEVVALIRSATGTAAAADSDKATAISTSEYLEMIERKSPAVEYFRGGGGWGKPAAAAVECAVCLSEVMEGESVRRLKCKHTFHRGCLDRWLQQRCMATCPLCRARVLPDEVAASYHRLKSPLDNTGDEEILFMMSLLDGNGLTHGVVSS
ncbi:hypothetical protein Tsubulata_015829 [Turnera subulata]|uniref:RING-type domain-containing protein n=1 Tax=Turnera subulata TaxID=218843 RepID=A0A9Q0IZW3_9ROSI|nr:hypothetical protein Tsubulata_015829 [Turnera subulata]